MSDYEKTHANLVDMDTSHEQMDEMWKYMYGKNFVVTNLTDHGKNWTCLNPTAQKSLKDVYDKAIQEDIK
jgi:hypothetical protein